MARVYNPQWDRMMDVDAALARRMTSSNFALQHTGGGCIAWERTTDDDGYVLITECEGISPGRWSERENPVWLIGRYNTEGDFITIGGCTLQEAFDFADILRAPVAEEQSMLSAIDYRED